MLRKLGSPRKGSKFAASSQDKADAKELSALGGGTSATAATSAGPTSPTASPTKRRLSLWSKKTPTPSAEASASPTAKAAPKGLEGDLNVAESKTIGSIQEGGDDEKTVPIPTEGATGRRSPLVRSPRGGVIADEEKKAVSPPEGSPGTGKRSPLVRSPRGGAIPNESEAKTLQAEPEKKQKSRSKRDSLGLKGLLAKREKANAAEAKPEQSSVQTPESPPRTRDGVSGSPTKKKSNEETPDAPLSPIRRKPRPSIDGLGAQTSTTATIREATSILSRKSVTRMDGVPPMQQPEVHIIGEIVGGDSFGKASDGYCCKWSVDYGNQWIHVAGDQIGQTQIDYSDSLAPDEGSVVWAHPIDLHFATTALHGWPKLLLQVWRVDSHMKMNVVGYGFVHLPFAPGHHRLAVSMWRPMGTSKEELGAVLLGHTPELLTDEVLFNTAWAERCRLKTIATGRVHVALGIIVRNFDAGVAHMDM